MDIQWTMTQPIKGNEILPRAAMWMDLESIMLSEISKIETNTVTHHLSVESKPGKEQCKRREQQVQRLLGGFQGLQEGGQPVRSEVWS